MVRVSIMPVLLLMVAVFVTAGCSARQAETAAPKAEVVDAGTFEKLAGGGDDVVVLDVRTPEEYASGHVPGAVNLDINSPGFDQKLSELAPGKTYLVYCRSGGRSTRACSAMAEQKVPAKAIYNLDGGITAWQSAGKPVEK